MKYIPVETITPSADSSFYCNTLENPYFPRTLHVHPEYELISIEQGDGMAFVGDMSCPMRSNMFMLIGQNLPHFWLSSEMYYKPENNLVSKCTYLQFSNDIFPKELSNLPEFMPIKHLLSQAGRGILFSGKEKDKLQKRFRNLPALNSFDKLLELYQILNGLAALEDNRSMSSIDYQCITDISQSNSVIRKTQNYLNENYNNEISLARIADIAGMNPTALCRYYKKHTGKTIFEHLTEIRISYASKLLLNNHLSVSQVAYDCGYTSLSHFNEQFKKIIGKTPREYTKDFNYKNKK